MALLIRNARVLTLTLPSASGSSPLSRPRRGMEMSELGILPQGEVLVSEGRIVAVGPKVEAPSDAEIIDAQGRVLMPGFVDCHTHLCWAGDRLGEWEQELRGVPYTEIAGRGGGIHATVRAVREATKKQLAAHLKSRLDSLLRDGTTTVEIKSGYGLQAEEELKMLRAIVRAGNDWSGTIVPTALLGHAFEGDLDEYARMVVKEMLPTVSREFPDVPVDAYCEKGAWSVEACVRFFEKASKHHPVRVHTDQFNPLGMIPEAIRLGARSADHLESASKADLLLLAQSRTISVVLPGTGFHLGSRYARAGFIIEAGGAVALGSNCNPGTAPTHSMPFIVALAVRYCGLSPAEAIVAATVNSAEVLGLADRGTIAPGQRADLVLLRHKDERLLAFEFGGNPVDLVICGGTVVRQPT